MYVQKTINAGDAESSIQSDYDKFVSCDSSNIFDRSGHVPFGMLTVGFDGEFNLKEILIFVSFQTLKWSVGILARFQRPYDITIRVAMKLESELKKG